MPTHAPSSLLPSVLVPFFMLIFVYILYVRRATETRTKPPKLEVRVSVPLSTNFFTVSAADNDHRLTDRGSAKLLTGPDFQFTMRHFYLDDGIYELQLATFTISYRWADIT